jgi:hypothetical protein
MYTFPKLPANMTTKSICVTFYTKEEHRLRVFDNRVLRKIWGLRGGRRQQNTRKDCTMRSFTTCTPNQTLIG